MGGSEYKRGKKESAMVKYSNESNFFGLPQWMGSIGKSRSINQMKTKDYKG